MQQKMVHKLINGTSLYKMIQLFYTIVLILLYNAYYMHALYPSARLHPHCIIYYYK